MQFSSLGVFDPVGVDLDNNSEIDPIIFDTDTLTVTGFAGTGSIEPTALGHSVAVFTFDSFNLDEDLTVIGTGALPLVILSKTDITIAGTVDVSAVSEGPGSNGARLGGAGGGDGGFVTTVGGTILNPATAATGAPANSVGAFISGGGGTGGGNGGKGGLAAGLIGDPGDAFDTLLDLADGVRGGSGGGHSGKASVTPRVFGVGGGGGGGIELGALGSIVITGSVLANGGDAGTSSGGESGGGGGAGGGILIHGTSVALASAGILSAAGGNGGNAVDGGGGGGGGKILVASVIPPTLDGMIDISGGVLPGSIDTEKILTRGGDGDYDTESITPSELPVEEAYTISIDWGDGTTPITGDADTDFIDGTTEIDDAVQGSFIGNHTYAEFGIYTVTVSVTSDTGADASETTDTETFQVYVAGVGEKDGNLLVVGTDGEDVVKVYRSHFGGSYKVLSKLAGGEWNLQSLASGSVNEIEIALGDGNDLAFVSSSVHLDATLDGGDGDDLLAGGGGNDILLGGDGFDLLYGAGGRDLMIGGSDGDIVFGDGGEDILISGTTAYDTHRTALDAIMAEWTSSRSYSERVANITNDNAGVRFNEDFFFVAEGDDATVFDDEALDWLVGGSGRDLYFAGEDDISFANWLEVVEELEADAPA